MARITVLDPPAKPKYPEGSQIHVKTDCFGVNVQLLVDGPGEASIWTGAPDNPVFQHASTDDLRDLAAALIEIADDLDAGK